MGRLEWLGARILWRLLDWHVRHWAGQWAELAVKMSSVSTVDWSAGMWPVYVAWVYYSRAAGF